MTNPNAPTPAQVMKQNLPNSDDSSLPPSETHREPTEQEAIARANWLTAHGAPSHYVLMTAWEMSVIKEHGDTFRDKSVRLESDHAALLEQAAAGQELAEALERCIWALRRSGALQGSLAIMRADEAEAALAKYSAAKKQEAAQ